MKKEKVLYLALNEYDQGEKFWATYESLQEAQEEHPHGTIIYIAILKPVGKTKIVLTELTK